MGGIIRFFLARKKRKETEKEKKQRKNSEKLTDVTLFLPCRAFNKLIYPHKNLYSHIELNILNH